jgi:hypothetical protein
MTITRRLAYASLVALGLAVIAAITVASGIWSPPPTTAQGLLGVALPPSAYATEVAVTRDTVGGGYQAYVRFTLDGADLTALLADPAFGPTATSTTPLAVFRDNSAQGKPLAQLVLEQRPAWWQPEAGQQFTLTHRSRPYGEPPSAGADMSWYIVDTSDPASVVVYVYAVEV